MLNLYELAKVINEKISVGVGSDGFCVSFLNCSLKNNRLSNILKSCWGTGRSIDMAADDYFSKINGRWLVFIEDGEIMREYSAEIAQKGK